jgi:hypothetical protein
MMLGRDSHLLLLGASKQALTIDDRDKKFWRGERCDSCCCQVWLPLKAADLVDEAEDAGRQTEILCPDCGVGKYGIGLILSMRAQGLIDG